MTPRFLIRLNAVDLLTLSAVITAGGALLLASSAPWLATALLFIAMLGDALDGILARRWQMTREFGRYLDGFMDMLIYLIAPTLIWYYTLLPGIVVLAAAIMLASGCVRLAVFNISGNIEADGGKLAYQGMPVFWSVFILAGSLLLSLALPGTVLTPLLIIVLLLFSYAMQLRRPFFKFRALWQILALTLGGAVLFLLLHVGQVNGHG